MSIPFSELQNVLLAREGFLAIVSVNRPTKLNALDDRTIAELDAVFAGLASDDSVGAIVLTGAGEKSFVAGADIGVLSKQGVLDGKQNALAGQALTLRIENCRKPVIAAINGFAFGGGLEMALACDLRFAAKSAKMGLPEVSLGIIPGYGGTQRLPRLVGTGVALQMILTGDPVTADEALRIGLVNGVFEPADLLAECKKVANKIVSRGPQAVSLAKEAVRRGVPMTMQDGLALEADLFGIISSTAEMKEGMAAFLEKRKPSWLRG
ncbi:MAG: enoyl-CoA hydratase/isomerase family protein [Planctomycetes bacterium]|nr:enoyl-CoA hydratase/isomerase family protein [Planctomycetota bacterium]MCC7062985.1 enoyl-CoA hydratase/isomerase family protein [Planctomycetota bacterium]